MSVFFVCLLLTFGVVHNLLHSSKVYVHIQRDSESSAVTLTETHIDERCLYRGLSVLYDMSSLFIVIITIINTVCRAG